MTHDGDVDDDDNDCTDDGFEREQQDPLEEAWRFGFSFGPNGLWVYEPQVFRHILRDMEELFSGLSRVPSIQSPPSQAGSEQGEKGASGNPLRDFMLKSPHSTPPPSSSPSGMDGGNPSSSTPLFPSSPFHHWSPFFKFADVWREGLRQRDKEETKGEDGDLDAQFPSEGQDQTQSLNKAQPKIRSSFMSVTVTKVVRPDGTVEERRTVRDSQGNEETTVTLSAGPGDGTQPPEQLGPGAPDESPRSSAVPNDLSRFSRFFRGFRG